MRRVLVVMVMSYLCALELPAQDTELLNRMKAMEEKIKTLEAQVQELKGQQAALTAAVTAATPEPAPP